MYKKEYPFVIREIDEELKQEYGNKKIYVGPKNICLYRSYKDEVLPQLYNFDSLPTDVWIFGYPRSGTTLIQEMVWLIENDLNYEKAAKDIIDVRFPVFELSAYFNFDKLMKEKFNYSLKAQKIIEKWAKPGWEKVREEREKRFIKTHIPISLANSNLLKSGSKIIYVARNPKDAIVSRFCLHLSINESSEGATESFEKFFQFQRKSNMFFHVIKEGWELRNHPNVLFLFYEEYKKDARTLIEKIATFFGRSLTNEDIAKLEDHLKIENFRKNETVNYDFLRELKLLQDKNDQFIRKGAVNSWKEYFNEKLNKEADEWIAENLKGTDLVFPDM